MRKDSPVLDAIENGEIDVTQTDIYKIGRRQEEAKWRSVFKTVGLLLELYEAKQEFPDLRIGQIISNAVKNRDIFYYEDDDLAKYIHEFRDEHKKEKLK